jgi:hypothetical protein
MKKMNSKELTGPNVNLKLPRNISPTPEQKEYFKHKIKKTKKTELCKNWELYNDCFYKDNCSFAHGEAELRQKSVENKQKYKTKKCNSFFESMYCPFGSRCFYKHKLPERQLYTYSQIIDQISEEIHRQMLNNHDVDVLKIFEHFRNNTRKQYKM